MFKSHFSQWLKFIAPAGVILAGAVYVHATDVDMESGKYFSSSVSTNNPFRDYFFQMAVSNSAIIRVANESDLYPNIADCFIYSPSNVLIASNTTTTDTYSHDLRVTNNVQFGWYKIVCRLPSALSGISNELAFSVSMLRLPAAPLSYADLDVGDINNGETKAGTINIGADLDAAFISVSNACTVQVRMGQGVPNLVPNIQVYDPSGQYVTSDFPPEYRAEITTTLTQTGRYTVVFNDKFNALGPYYVSLVQIPGALISGSDKDIGMIINGETKTGAIDQPGDLDPAYFNAVSGDVVRVIMNEIDQDLNPVIELYSPSGLFLTKATDPFQHTAVIDNYSNLNNGVFTVICKDAEDRYNKKYSLTFTVLSGPSIDSSPIPPTGVDASDGTHANYIEVHWTASAGANGYDIYRSFSTNMPIQIWTNFTQTTYNDSNVTTSVYYYYKVKARNDYGISDFSASDSGYAGSAPVLVTTRRALVVGLNRYDPTYIDSSHWLQFCTNDAMGIKDILLLGDPSNRWPTANIQLMLDAQGTKAAIRNALHTLATESAAGDIVIYTQSSHGGNSTFPVLSTNTYLCTYNADYTDTELASDLALFLPETKVIVIVDACYSGGLFMDRNAPVDWPFAERVMAEFKLIKRAQLEGLGAPVPRTLGQNIAFMTACAYDETSFEIEPYGLYTGYLLQGCTLTTVDTNLDNEYEFMELQAYAVAKTLEALPTQHAQTHNAALLQSTVARAVGSSRAAQRLDNDYDGDDASDLAIYNESAGMWYIWSFTRGILAWDVPLGGPGYKAVTGDYDGDGRADLAIYNLSSGEWYIWSLTRGILTWGKQWGGGGLVPVAGDYTGDCATDLAVYDNNAGYWYVVTLNDVLIIYGTSFAGTGFMAVPGDFNGDRIADYAMYHSTAGFWYVITTAGAQVTWGTPWGAAGYIPVPGDFDGDGASDLAIYNTSTGIWYIWSLARQSIIAWNRPWGGAGFTPVAGDFNGDGIADMAVYHENSGYWFIQTADGLTRIAWALKLGAPGYTPVRPTW